MSADPAEDRLAALARDGCGASFESLARRVRPRLVRVLARQLGDAHLAEDLTQDALLRARQKLALYDPSRPFAPWLFTLALRLGRSAMRRDARRPRSESLASSHGDAWRDPAPGPDQSLAQRELAQRVWRTAEAALSPDAFTALWLVYTEGASPREAAHAIGRSPGATRVLLHRARKTLRESLDASDATSTQAVSHMADDVSPHGQASLGATP